MTAQTEEVKYHIREATEADRRAIDEINRRSWAGRITTHELLERRHGRINGQDWTDSITNAVADHLARPDVMTFVAVNEDGRVIGYAAAQIRDGPHADMGTVSYNAVDPDYQGKGIGTALIERVAHYLEGRGARVLTVVTVESDEPAKHIYERMGFKKLTSLIYYSKDC